jgi:hypothetical protein
MVFVTSKVVKHEWAAIKNGHIHYQSRYQHKNLADSSVTRNNDMDTARFIIDSTSAGQKNDIKASDNRKKRYADSLIGNLSAAGSLTKSLKVDPNKGKTDNNVSSSPIANDQEAKNLKNLFTGKSRVDKNSVGARSNNRSYTIKSFSDQSRAQLQGQANYRTDNSRILLSYPYQSLNFNMPQATTLPMGYPHANLSLAPLAKGNIKNKSSGSASKPQSAGNLSSFEWGLLVGVNSPGSFTPKSQNANFYGSLGIDPFAGAYATYHFSDKWRAGLQLRVLSPSTITGSYQIPHKIQNDSINTTTYRAQADSRKLYSIQVPIYATCQLTNFAALKGGPVLGFPIKQFSTAKTDSASMQLLTSSRYDQKFDLGLSGGVTLRYKRFSFDVAYLRGLTTHNVKGDSLSYKMHNSQLQFTIGIQLGWKKR